MSKAKTKINIKTAYIFLKEKIGYDVKNIALITGGETSRTFCFQLADEDFVIRFNFKKTGFLKDEYAHRHFNTTSIPIPKCLQISKFNKSIYYSITEKAKGKIVDDFSKKEIKEFMPAIIETLNAIHSMPINSDRFGDWNKNGLAKNNSWEEYLLQLIDDFSNIKKDIILEKKIVEKILKTYKTLIPFCPNIKHLVHGDFGFNNLLVDNKKVTGVIDWELAKYGDFLYDVAWLSFWDEKIKYADIFLKWYNEHNVMVPNFRERILCYKLHFGLWALDFYSRSEQRKKYERTKKKLLQLIEC